METFKELLEEGTQVLKKGGIEEARLDAWLLLEYAAGITRAWYFAHDDNSPDEETAVKYRELCTRRARRIPLQHLTGRAYFMGYEFEVDERVLIPRQDTEILAEEALHLLKDLETPEILDMCTGSGCLLLSILMEKEDAHGTGVDISSDALEVAVKNRRNLNLEKRALFVRSDMFSDKYFHENSGNRPLEYDMLISNPPYIPTADIQQLMEEVRLHDPVLALDGREDGLYFYRRITSEAGRYLKPGGWLLYEIGCDQGEAVTEIMKLNDFSNIAVKKDLAGLDRVVLGQKKQEV